MPEAQKSVECVNQLEKRWTVGVIQATHIVGSFVCAVFISGLERSHIWRRCAFRLWCAAVKNVGVLQKNCL